MAKLIFRKDRLLAPGPSQRVLKAGEALSFSELSEAAGELAAMKREWEEKKRAEEELMLSRAASLYEEKMREGYEEGLARGKEEESMKIMDAVLASISYLEKLEGDVAGLVLQCVERIMGETGREELIRGLVKKALSSMRGDRRLVLRVAPSNEESVRKELAGLFSAAGTESRGFVEIRPDPRLGPSACHLESELGNVDASLSTQLKNLRKAIEERLVSG